MPAVLRATVACALLVAFTSQPGHRRDVRLQQSPAATADDVARGRVVDAFSQAAERLALMAAIKPADSRVEYSLARACARAGRKADAIAALKRAVKKGFSDRAAIDTEPDFDAVRGEEAFRTIVAAVR